MTVVSSANLIIVFELCGATQSCVNSEYRRGLSTEPCGAPVLSQSGGGVVAHPHSLGSAHQEVQYPAALSCVQSQVPELGDKVRGHYGVEC